MNQMVIFGAGDIANYGIAPLARAAHFNVYSIEKKRVDVRRSEQIWDWFKQHDVPDVVVFTAGISRIAKLPESEPDEVAEEIDTNLLGAFNVAQLATFLGVEKLIFIASVAGLYGKPEHAAYSASKAGLISLVQSLAAEGYQAYAISPGRVDTQMRQRDYPDEDPKTRLTPAQIGNLVMDIINGKYEPGDNLIIRMKGYETLPIEVHQGDGWKEKLKIGQPKTV
jgi:NAD(P)-dependent dehydrogenase (short-subunit alcohol dehydrogenase family)